MKAYRLTFPPGARCIVPDCDRPVTRVLNLRIRRTDTGASYGPNIDGAYLCTHHGDGGARIGISFSPRRTGEVTTRVYYADPDGGLPTPVASMSRPMSGGHPGQESIL